MGLMKKEKVQTDWLHSRGKMTSSRPSLRERKEPQERKLWEGSSEGRGGKSWRDLLIRSHPGSKGRIKETICSHRRPRKNEKGERYWGDSQLIILSFRT